MKTAIVIGATGLVGSAVVDQLLEDERIGQVLVFVRRPTGRQHSKLREQVIDFNDPSAWQGSVKGDILFSALGTTLKKAGSKEAQFQIDYTYQLHFARAAARNGVSTYVLVSSAGASTNSRIFYSRMKGELEEEIKKLPFNHIHILQPGILEGKRQESRPGEKAGVALMSVLQHVPGLKKYRPIPAETVARAMIRCCFDKQGKLHVYTWDGVFKRAGEA
jgi:uncharacterized protein YbjT (DUF2867 family)